MKNLKIKLALAGALVLRLGILPFGRHSDSDNTFHWARYLWDKKDFFGFLGKAVPDAMPAFYPPVFYYAIFLWRGAYDLFGQGLWWLNLKISYFPSNLIFLYQSYQGGVAFNKLLASLLDFGCAYLVYRLSLLVGAKNKLAAAASLLFLFLPPYWYNSAHWGQDESFYAFFLLLGFSLALKEKYLWGVISLATSVLIKQSGFCVLPVFFVYALKKRKAADLAVGGFSSLALAQILYFPFFPLNTLSLAFSHYWQSLRGELGYLVCNAFNFWAFIFGFEQRPADMNLAGLPAYVWGYFLFGLVLALILYRLWRKATKEALVRAAFLAGFAAFLFLPKMHERYFYTSAVFLAVLAGLNKKMLTAFMVLSLIHQVNLYHFFWSPKIPLLITLFSNALVLKILILINLVIFAKLLLGYLKHEIA